MKKYIIIGGGPAGTALGNFLLKNGISDVTIIEKETFPRHHIGESMQPDIFNIFDQIGIDTASLESQFPKKFGAVYKWGKSNDKWTVLYSKDLDDKWTNGEPVESLDGYEYGFNLDRSKFDSILLDGFVKKGGNVIHKKVDKIIFSESGDSQNIDELILSDGEKLKADVYIDATGQNSMLSSLFGLKEFDSYLRNSAIYGYYKNYKPLDPILGKDFQFIENIGGAWYWWIPISYDVVSVGIVFNSQKKLKDMDFLELVKQSEIYESIKEAELLGKEGEPEKKFRYISDWSFLSKSAFGSNRYLVGDSFGFVDPILSGGASFAMEKAIYLGKILILNEKIPNRRDELNIRYESDYKKDVVDYLKMAYLWYENGNSKTQWLDETGGTKSGFVDYISGGKRFLHQKKIFQDWQNVKIGANLL